ncbi:hypothetical protein SAY87_024194 [Trapa incisa]|uniref:Trichome birefringence-like N-terminal domain-containing protein n=2 Tax=Trapa TaxID=22665 RepID=A0AAN7KTV4_9MYRT|nr:hypothetical protein SAY87_024194 [Trapa incisa]
MKIKTQYSSSINQLYRSKPTPQKKLIAPTLVLLLIMLIIPLYLFIDSFLPLQPPSKLSLYSGLTRSNFGLEKQYCDLFRGTWVPYPNATYYTNETCPLIIDQQNCLKFGRLNTDFLKWRWKPDDCELPRFDATEFFEMAKGKSIAFVGDSVGRNQMQSLLCLLATVSDPADLTLNYTSGITNFIRWLFPEYNLTIASFWAPFLVKAADSDSNGHTYTSTMSLYLDEPEENWARDIVDFDYVIVSAGQWFYRPLMFYEKGRLVGCASCGQRHPEVTEMSRFYGYRMAFRTTFRTLKDLKGYKGVTFLRTFSPGHYENGAWNDGGNCARTRPLGKEEVKLEGYHMDFYNAQAEEFRAASWRRQNKLKLLDTTGASLMRPDGHPNIYGRSPNRNATFNDCVHWCVPGPIDTWNEFLFHLMKPLESRKLSFWDQLRRSSP